MINFLDRYIFRETFSSFLFGVLSFTAIMGGSSALIPVMQDAGKYGIPFFKALQIFLLSLPAIMVFTFPMSMLLATILTFGRLSSDHEILAFRSVGVGFFRIVRSVIFLGLLVSLMTIWMNESIVPNSKRSANNLKNSFRYDKDFKIKQRVNLTEYTDDGLPSRIINVVEVNGDSLYKVTVLEYESGEMVRAIKADSGKWLKSGGWEFYDGTMHTFSKKDKKKVILIEFKKEIIDIYLDPTSIQNREKKNAERSAIELKKHIAFLKRTGHDYKRDLVDYHMKFAIPFASFLFAILGSCLGVRPHRSSSSVGFGISILIILGYYLLHGISMGFVNTMTPWVVAWIPNFVIGIISLYYLRQKGRQ